MMVEVLLVICSVDEGCLCGVALDCGISRLAVVS